MYKYGMKHRPFDIGCQPSGVQKHIDSEKQKTGFWSFIFYNEKLTDKQIYDYELKYLGEEE